MRRVISRKWKLLSAVGALALAAAVGVVSTLLLQTARIERTAVRPLRIAIVGDAYAAGSNNRVVWPTLLAQRTGWSVANFAQPNAGFAADGAGGLAFAYQVDRAQAADPQVIVLVSGVGDLPFAGSGSVYQGAIDALNKINVGSIRALAVGPTWYETPVPPEVVGVSDEVRKAADETGVSFLGALDPPWLTSDLMQPDLTGPTDDGQSVIADKLAAWLRGEIDHA